MAKRKSKTAGTDNRKALWKAYRDLHKRADAAWTKFRKDLKQSAGPNVLMRDQNHLLLLLGECNYMARECQRIANKKMR
jgi:hypothetical protein